MPKSRREFLENIENIDVDSVEELEMCYAQTEKKVEERK